MDLGVSRMVQYHGLLLGLPLGYELCTIELTAAALAIALSHALGDDAHVYTRKWHEYPIFLGGVYMYAYGRLARWYAARLGMRLTAPDSVGRVGYEGRNPGQKR